MNREALVAKARASRGAINDLIDAAWEHYKANGRESWATAFQEAAADKVVQRFEDKIRNGFSRAGLELPAGELNQATMLGVVREQTGLEVTSLDPESVTRAVDTLLAKRLSLALKVQVTTVFDRDALMASINDAVIQAIQSGRAGEWLNAKAYHAARRFATYQKRGVSMETAKVLAARARQKRYRGTHKLIWL